MEKKKKQIRNKRSQQLIQPKKQGKGVTKDTGKCPPCSKPRFRFLYLTLDASGCRLSFTSIHTWSQTGGSSQKVSPGQEPKKTNQKEEKTLPWSPSSFMRVRERGNLYTNCRPSGNISPSCHSCGVGCASLNKVPGLVDLFALGVGGLGH